MLEAHKIGQAGIKAANPTNWLEKVSGMDPKSTDNPSECFRVLEKWDPGKIAELKKQFTSMPDDKQQQAAQVVAAARRYSDANSSVTGEAIRYPLVNPVARPEAESNTDTDPMQMASEYATNLAIRDPAAASEWVGSLPAGDAKRWAQKNMARNWAIYDPKAAQRWVASLPVDARSEVRAFMKEEK